MRKVSEVSRGSVPPFNVKLVIPYGYEGYKYDHRSDRDVELIVTRFKRLTNFNPEHSVAYGWTDSVIVTVEFHADGSWCELHLYIVIRDDPDALGIPATREALVEHATRWLRQYDTDEPHTL